MSNTMNDTSAEWSEVLMLPPSEFVRRDDSLLPRWVELVTTDSQSNLGLRWDKRRITMLLSERELADPLYLLNVFHGEIVSSTLLCLIVATRK